MSASRVFTLEAVNALVPKLSVVVGRQLQRRTGIEELLARLGREPAVAWSVVVLARGG